MKMTDEEYEEMLWLENKRDLGTITVDEKKRLADLCDIWCFDSKPITSRNFRSASLLKQEESTKRMPDLLKKSTRWVIIGLVAATKFAITPLVLLFLSTIILAHSTSMIYHWAFHDAEGIARVEAELKSIVTQVLNLWLYTWPHMEDDE
jgi:hypothetical protein